MEVKTEELHTVVIGHQSPGLQQAELHSPQLSSSILSRQFPVKFLLQQAEGTLDFYIFLSERIVHLFGYAVKEFLDR